MNRSAWCCLLVLVSCGSDGLDGARGHVFNQPTSTAVVVLADERVLLRAAPQGTRRLFTFGEGADAEFVSVIWWQAAGGFVAGVALMPEPGGENVYEVALLTTDGAVLFQRRQRESGNPTAHLSADGTLAIAGDRGTLVRPDGTVLDLGELHPQSAALRGGGVLVARGPAWDDTAPQFVWRDGTLTPLSPFSPHDVVFSEGRALAVVGEALVSLEDGASVPLPGVGFGVLEASAGRWALLARRPRDVVVADLEQGTAALVANLPAPVGYDLLRGLALGEGGAVLAQAQVEGGLQLRRSADLGQRWDDVGTPIALEDLRGGGTALRATERGGATLVLGLESGYGHFVRAVQLVTPAGARQLDTGGLFLNTEGMPRAAVISEDGRLAAVWVPRAGGVNLALLDAGGAAHELLALERPGELRFAR